MFALGSEYTKSAAFIFGKCHNVFLHINPPKLIIKKMYPYSLRHYKVDVTLGVSVSYLSQVKHSKRPLSERIAGMLSKSVKQDEHKIAKNPITNRLRYSGIPDQIRL
jgi:hypothetical protein